MTRDDRLYSFAFRGLLTEEALDRSGRVLTTPRLALERGEISEILSTELLPSDLIEEAEKMSVVYTTIAAFENAVRELVAGVLLESKGETWWNECVGQKIRTRAEKRRDDEQKIRWHTQRGSEPINYTTMADLVNVIRNNWDDFEPYLRSVEWAASVFDAIERSRNVIMHSGSLERGDIERLGVFIRDWVKQVGT